MLRPRVAILIADMFEDSEFIYPYYRLIEAGVQVDVVGQKEGDYRGKHGTHAKATRAIETLKSSDYDALYVPGGHAPQKLQNVPQMVAFVASMYRSGKTVCAVCHGPLLLASAGVLNGKKVTGYRSVKEELLNAGADYSDKAVEEDGTIITARDPAALPAMMKRFLARLEA